MKRMLVAGLLSGLLCAAVSAAPAAPTTARGVATLYVIGDSTAAANAPDRHPRMGWAQVLQEYFDAEKLVVDNRAKGGRSSKSFLDEGLWTPIRDALKTGDYVFIQFGHNDSKKEPERRTEPDTTYRRHLQTYIDDTRSRGAVPVLLTPINRNAWNPDGRLAAFFGEYPRAARELAAELGVPLVDLTELTRRSLEAMGPEKAKSWFMRLEKGQYPNFPDGSEDNTHLQEYGARAVCGLIAADLLEKPLPLKSCLKSGPPDAGAIKPPAFPQQKVDAPIAQSLPNM